MKKTLLFVAILVLVVFLGAYFQRNQQVRHITNFQECVDAGNPVMESYPRQCRTKDGQLFVEEIGNELEKSGLIRLSSPHPNQTITSPLVVTGEARGFWFFEATFPIVLTDWDGRIIAEGFATAEENPNTGEINWMTEDFVPFSAILEFQTPTYKNNGSLILQKSNASGLPEHDDALEIPIFFSELGDNKKQIGTCRPTGCSSQLCADEDLMSTCEFLPEYACYQQHGVCERQPDGACGWTQTQELTACLNDPPEE